MRIRTADMSDLKEIARVEAECFPAAEAATEEEFEKRLTFYNTVWFHNCIGTSFQFFRSTIQCTLKCHCSICYTVNSNKT